MARPLLEINKLVMKHKCSFILAGDVFDTWRVPPELISFAIKHLPPRTFAIPGQHDLPFHNYKDRTKSAYWTLVEAGVLIDMEPGKIFDTPSSVICHPFPWGSEIETNKWAASTFGLHLAVVHSFIWTSKTTYPGAPMDHRLGELRKKLKGYDAAVFGDNHKGFLAKKKGKKCPVLNGGTLMRRHSDEVGYRPSVGLLMDDGTIVRHYLDVSKDKFINSDKIEKLAQGVVDLSGFLQQLTELGTSSFDFIETVLMYMKGESVSKGVKQELSEAIDHKDPNKKGSK